MDATLTFQEALRAQKQSEAGMDAYMRLFPAADKIERVKGLLASDAWFSASIAEGAARNHVFGLLERTYDSVAWTHQTAEDIVKSVCKTLRFEERGVSLLKPDATALTQEKLLSPFQDMIRHVEDAAKKAVGDAPGTSVNSGFLEGFSKLSGMEKVSIGLSSIFAGWSLLDGVMRLFSHSRTPDENGQMRMNYSQIGIGLAQASIGVGIAYLTQGQYKQATKR